MLYLLSTLFDIVHVDTLKSAEKIIKRLCHWTGAKYINYDTSYKEFKVPVLNLMEKLY